MSPTLLLRHPSRARISDAELAAGLRKALNGNYGRVLATAGRHWERSFARQDPSDACVSVRVSETTRPRSLLSGSYHIGY